MKVVQSNKKNNNHISLLIIKSLPKQKFDIPISYIHSQNYSSSNLDSNEHHQYNQFHSHIQLPTKDQITMESKPAVVTLSFDQQNKKRQHSKQKAQRKLLTSACIEQNARKQHLIYKQQMEIERKHNLEEFVMQNLHIGPCDVKRMTFENGYNSRRFTSCRQRRSIKLQPYKNNKQILTCNKLSIDPTIYTTRNINRNLLKCKKSETMCIKKDTVEVKMSYNFKPIRKPAKKDYFIFGMTDKNLPLNKIQIYRDFLWKVNFSNDLYVVTPETNDSGYKAYIGTGNNSIMVKGILKRRFWWTITDKPNLANFVWTQLKMNSYFDEQNPSRYRQRLENDESNTQESDRQEQSPDEHRYIFRASDLKLWETHMEKNAKCEEKISEQTYLKRMWFLNKKTLTKIENSFDLKVHNHFQSNFYLGNKKALFYNLRKYYQLRNQNIFTIIPETYHITRGVDDPEYIAFVAQYTQKEKIKHIDRNFRNIWIAKPGENSNRGNGISVCFSLDDVRLRLRGKEKNRDGKARTFIIQKYIQTPLLYQRRKFDIRHYLLITCMNGDFKAYWYQQGYIRTSSVLFSLRNTKDLFTHLTNDAIQKHGEEYGKYEKGNKVSYEQFQNYIEKVYKTKKISFYRDILPKMKQIALDAVKSSYLILDPLRRQRNFQVFGLDFMIDQSFDPWLIECNTNPCLQLSCPLLARLIPSMVENLFKICLDPLFPPPENWQNGRRHFFGENPIAQNRFELIFDEKTDGRQILKIYTDSQRIDNRMGKIEEDDEIFEDDGNQKWEESDQT